MSAASASVSAHVAHVLAARITEAFGVMGNGNAYLLDALDDTPVRYTAVRHEAGAVVAADAYYRASGRLAVATATYGAGFTNTLTALAESAQARIPLVLVVGDQPSTGPRPWDVAQSMLATAVGVRTVTVTAADAAARTLEAIDLAVAERVPVVLAVPYDLAAADAGPLAPVPAPGVPSGGEPDPVADAALEDVAGMLAEARRPYLLAGRGAWLADAGESLGALAAAVGAVTSTTALARAIFPESRYDLGVTGGFGQETAMRLIATADVAIVFGAALNQFTMRFGNLFGADTKVVQIDTGEGPTHPRVDVFVRADARRSAEVLTARVERARSHRSDDAAPWRETIDFEPLRTRDVGVEPMVDGRLDPRAVAARIGELLPADRVVVSDGGHFIGWANMYWPVSAPDRMVMVGTAFQSIGLGLPSVAGAARAKPGSTIVLTAGDGGSLMALADLETAVRVTGGGGLAVIWNDAAYGAELHLYGLNGLAKAPMLIPQTDFAGLATALGGEGVTVESLSDLDRLASWTAEDPSERRFLVLDCHVSSHVMAPYQREIVEAATR